MRIGRATLEVEHYFTLEALKVESEASVSFTLRTSRRFRPRRLETLEGAHSFALVSLVVGGQEQLMAPGPVLVSLFQGVALDMPTAAPHEPFEIVVKNVAAETKAFRARLYEK